MSQKTPDPSAATAQEKLYTQADLDFFSATADEYFEMTITLRRERDDFRDALKWALAHAPLLVVNGIGLKERVRRLNRFRDALNGVLYPKEKANV